MSVPNLQSVVQTVRDSRAWDFTTKTGLCAYSHAVVEALHAADANIGHLVKSEAQNHCTDAQGRRHAVDVALYRPTGQIIDFISSAGFGDPPPANAVTWTVGPEGEYPETSWFAPVPESGTTLHNPGMPPPSTDLTQILTRLTLLESRANLFMDLASEITKQIGILNQQLANLDAAVVKQPLPDYEGTGRIFGFGFSVISRPR